MAKWLQLRRALRINRRGSVSPAVCRCAVASAASSWIACRTSCAVEFAGIGLPNETVTGYGMLLGHFQKKRPRSKLKTLPHRRSKCTGMMGTARPSIAAMPSMIFSMPRLNGRMFPVRLMAPSAKMHTTCPAASSFRAARMASTASRPPPTGIAFVLRKNQFSAFIW